MNALKDHPFAVEAYFKSSIVLTFAVPKELLQSFIPDKLRLDVFDDKWAFIAVAMVDTKDLRPKGFPKITGRDFFLIGYRIFVRYTNQAGKSLRGLYIIKSETDKKAMEFFGNMFTHYDYSTTDVKQVRSQNHLKFCSVKSDFNLEVDLSDKIVNLPINSPFADWKEARRYAGPLPFTFTYDAEKNKMLIIEGVRENWTPVPLQVEEYRFSFLEKLALKDLRLANAFIIKEIPYCWKKGKTEIWN